MHSDTNRIWTLRHNKKTLETSSSGPTHQNKRCPSVFSGFLAPSFYGKTLRDENKKQAVSFLFISLFNYFSRRLHSKQWVCWGGHRKSAGDGGGCGVGAVCHWCGSFRGHLSSPHPSPSNSLLYRLYPTFPLPIVYPSPHPHHPHPPTTLAALAPGPCWLDASPYISKHPRDRMTDCMQSWLQLTPPPRSSVIHSFMNSLIFITKKREKDLNCTRI